MCLASRMHLIALVSDEGWTKLWVELRCQGQRGLAMNALPLFDKFCGRLIVSASLELESGHGFLGVVNYLQFK